MKYHFARAINFFASIMFLVFGFLLLLNPHTLESFDIILNSEVAKTEIRAFYGGLQIGIAVLILIFELNLKQTKNTLMIVACAFGFIAIARSIGMYLDQSSSGFLYFALMFEATLSCMALLFYSTYDKDFEK